MAFEISMPVGTAPAQTMCVLVRRESICRVSTIGCVGIRLALRVVMIAFDRKSTAQRASAGHGGLLGYDLNGDVIYTKAVPDRFVEEFCRKHGYANLEEAISAREK